MADGQFPLIPPFSQVAEFLNGNYGFYQIFEWAKDDKNLSIYRIDRKTLKSGTTSGVNPRTAEKFEHNINQICMSLNIPMHDRFNVDLKTIQPQTNGVAWLKVIEGLFFVLNKHSPSLKISNTIRFLNRRRRVENILFYKCKKTMKSVSIKNKQAMLEKSISTCYKKSLLIEPELIYQYSVAVSKAMVDRNEIDDVSLANILKHNIMLKIDFYYQLSTSFMLDMIRIMDLLQLPPVLHEQLLNYGGLGKLYPKINSNSMLLTPTFQLYELWQTAFSENESKISYKEMSQHISEPDNSRTRSIRERTDEEIEHSNNDTRLKKLQKWRKGTVPEFHYLSQFVESLSGEKYNGFYPIALSIITMAWSKIFIHERENLQKILSLKEDLSKYINEDWLLSAFASYDKYWQAAPRSN
ncbi:hypothetical protein V6243_04470 [Cobetia marina]|uniref:Uncharacterized protein n=1 Tax=Cobetia marina TaxID=28258 RepID=A0ABU9GGG3_COBMA